MENYKFPAEKDLAERYRSIYGNDTLVRYGKAVSAVVERPKPKINTEDFSDLDTRFREHQGDDTEGIQ